MIVDPDDPATVYVATGRDGSCRVVRLRRVQPGSLTMSNEDITADLPTGIRVSALAVDRMNLGTIYAGTRNRAVYRGRLSAGSGTWRWDRYSDGLPFAAAVVDLLAHPTTGVLRAGTCGRGAFEVNTDHPLGSVLAIEGIPIFLRVHDAGGFGPPSDRSTARSSCGSIPHLEKRSGSSCARTPTKRITPGCWNCCGPPSPRAAGYGSNTSAPACATAERSAWRSSAESRQLESLDAHYTTATPVSGEMLHSCAFLRRSQILKIC